MKQSICDLLKDVKKVANEYLLLDDDNLVEIPLAVYVANKLPADPLWMFITGPPSNAKTEILRAMDGCTGTFSLGSLTANTLISGKQGKDEDGNPVDFSLLPKLSNKLVVIKDFTTILNLKDDTKAQILSQFREIYDGQISKGYGTGKVFSWDQKVGVIAAVTDIIDKHMSVNQLLGERFLHYRTSNTERFAVAKRSMANLLGDSNHRQRLHDVITAFLEHVNNPIDVTVEKDENIEDKIAALAVFCATARTGVSRDRYTKTVDFMPQAEGPARLAKQLLLLASSLTIVRGLEKPDEGVYQVVVKVVRDSLPSIRLKLLDALWELYCEKQDWYTTTEIAEEAGMPGGTAVINLENMMLLDLVRRDKKEDHQTAPYVWIPSKFLDDLQNITNCLLRKKEGEGKKEK
jgi:hypothetical protein